MFPSLPIRLYLVWGISTRRLRAGAGSPEEVISIGASQSYVAICLKTGQMSTSFSVSPFVGPIVADRLFDFQNRPDRSGGNFERRKTDSKLHCKRFCLGLRPCVHERRYADESSNPDQWLPVSLIQFAVGVALHAAKGPRRRESVSVYPLQTFRSSGDENCRNCCLVTFVSSFSVDVPGFARRGGVRCSNRRNSFTKRFFFIFFFICVYVWKGN